jgi:hypothetical protein
MKPERLLRAILPDVLIDNFDIVNFDKSADRFDIYRLSGNFWLVSFKISYLCLPLFHETRTTPSCHPSGCAYRQL